MRTLFFALAMGCMGVVAYAQPQPPSNPVPLDGGIGLLVAAGTVYGAKRLARKRKED